MKIIDIVAVNERFFPNKDEHAIFVTFRGEIIGGNISIENPEEISEISWTDISKADKLMPYHKSGINGLIGNSATYYNQN